MLIAPLLAGQLLLTPMAGETPAQDAPKPGQTSGVAAHKTAIKPRSEALHALLEAEWEYNMREYPTWASTLGDRRWNDKWEDSSFEAIERRHKHKLELIDRLKGFERDALSEEDQLTYDLYTKDVELDIEEHKYRWHLIPMNQRGGVQTDDELVELLPFERVKDYEDWIGRLRGFPAVIEQTIALMREGARTKTILPKIVLQRIPAQIDKQIVDDPAASPFYAPFKDFPKEISTADRDRLSKAAQDAIRGGIVPGFRKLKDFFTKEYLPAAFDEVGVWQMPMGAERYAFAARRQTTTSMTPEQIHQKGLAEVARIRAEMHKIMERVGFKGTLQEFFHKLRTDSQFFYKTPEELLAAYQAMTRRIDPQLVKVIKTLPRTPYGVVPIPDKIAPDTTTAYYQGPAADGSRAGLYYVNLYKPETRPKWEMMALSLHEAVPGHHLQIALSQELGDMPKFRKFGGYTAYVEGWALYAESLGEEMGLYEDPYDKFGQLTYEMWRAVRLVVDTGMHHMRWSRDKAIAYFMDNAAKTEQDVVNEIDRYIAWPGQALAYKIGELKIKELRARASKKLGDKFDLREFHDVILGTGALPLDLLEQQVDRWIASKSKAA